MQHNVSIQICWRRKVTEENTRRKNRKIPHPFEIACAIVGIDDFAEDWDCSMQYVYRIRKKVIEDSNFKFPANRVASVVRLTNGSVTAAQLRPDLAEAFKG